MKKFLAKNGTLFALVIIAVISAFLSKSFFTADNLSNLTRQVAIVGVIAVGMTMVILLAGIDLSVGSLVGLAGVVIALLLQAGIVWWLAILITLVSVGFVIGAWNGFWIARLKIPPFIITLGMMTIARGLAHLLTEGQTITISNEMFKQVGNGYISISLSVILLVFAGAVLLFMVAMDIIKRKKHGLELDLKDNAGTLVIGLSLIILLIWIYSGSQGIPIPVAIMALIAIMGSFMLRYSRFGRELYAIGGNEEASRLSGINTRRSTLWVYIIISVLATVGGLISASRLNGGSPNEGISLELDVIAAVVIGGTSLTGGFGTVRGTIIGTFIIGILNNGMSLRGIDSNVQNLIKGFIIIGAVAFDVLQKKNKQLGIIEVIKKMFVRTQEEKK